MRKCVSVCAHALLARVRQRWVMGDGGSAGRNRGGELGKASCERRRRRSLRRRRRQPMSGRRSVLEGLRKDHVGQERPACPAAHKERKHARKFPRASQSAPGLDERTRGRSTHKTTFLLCRKRPFICLSRASGGGTRVVLSLLYPKQHICCGGETVVAADTHLATWFSVSRSTNPLLRRKLLQLVGSPWFRQASMRSPITWSSSECCERLEAWARHKLHQ